jgi:hypothetical protein
MQKEELEKLNALDKEIEKTQDFISNLENTHIRTTDTHRIKYIPGGKANATIQLKVGITNSGQWQTHTPSDLIGFLSYNDKEDIESRILALNDQYHRYILALAYDKLTHLREKFEEFTGTTKDEDVKE